MCDTVEWDSIEFFLCMMGVTRLELIDRYGGFGSHCQEGFED